MLQGHDESAGILRLVPGEELQHLGQRPHKLQEAVLEGPPGRRRLALLEALLAEILHLLREAAQRPAGDGGEVERAELVELHHLWHGREAQARVQAIAVRLHDLDQLLGELLHEDERAHEDVGALEVLLQLLLHAGVTDLFQEIAHTLRAHALVGLVDLAHRG
eukprot:5486425-Pyramimonas_sp.AAC.1